MTKSLRENHREESNVCTYCDWLCRGHLRPGDGIPFVIQLRCDVLDVLQHKTLGRSEESPVRQDCVPALFRRNSYLLPHILSRERFRLGKCLEGNKIYFPTAM